VDFEFLTAGVLTVLHKICTQEDWARPYEPILWSMNNLYKYLCMLRLWLSWRSWMCT